MDWPGSNAASWLVQSQITAGSLIGQINVSIFIVHRNGLCPQRMKNVHLYVGSKQYELAKLAIKCYFTKNKHFRKSRKMGPFFHILTKSQKDQDLSKWNPSPKCVIMTLLLLQIGGQGHNARICLLRLINKLWWRRLAFLCRSDAEGRVLTWKCSPLGSPGETRQAGAGQCKHQGGTHFISRHLLDTLCWQRAATHHTMHPLVTQTRKLT